MPTVRTSIQRETFWIKWFAAISSNEFLIYQNGKKNFEWNKKSVEKLNLND